MNFLERNGLQTTQTHFKDIFQNNIHRNYADTMLGWLERETDFFTAPASTKHHGAHPGGLLVHSGQGRSGRISTFGRTGGNGGGHCPAA